jgi:hypothetical protein
MRHSGTLFTLAVTTLASLGVVSLSDAKRAEIPFNGAAHATEPMIAPVSGGELFQPVRQSGRNVDRQCLSQDDVFTVFAGDIQQVGGEIVVMTDGVQQNFSDYWRRTAGVDQVDVSVVVAHLVPDVEAEPIVDLVEFDQAGCAISRTLMSHGDWLELLQRSHGVEV